jgi:hypothetical protein
MLGFAKIALAMEISCFSPVESLSPPSPTGLSYPFSSLPVILFTETISAAF